MSRKISSTFPGSVTGIVEALLPNGQEKAQITVEEGDHLFRELRIDNTLKSESGDDVSLKLGAHVELTVSVEEE